MPIVHLMQFQPSTRRFLFFKELDLLAVPRKGEKITFDIDGIGWIAEVHDVIYGDNGGADVHILPIQDLTQYYMHKKGWPDEAK